MKSIMHEASSIAKAIEQGWEKAGSPVDFSVKILERPKKNFLGFTTHPAKIAIYFDERSSAPQSSRQDQRPHKVREIQQRADQRPQSQRHHEPRPEQRAPHTRQHEVSAHEPRRHTERPVVKPVQQHAEPPVQGNRLESQWTDAMMGYAREWLDVVLPESVGKRVGFTVEPNNLYLRITFESGVLDNQEKEKRLFASLSLLILEALKRKFKVGLRKHKIILTTG